MTERFKAEIVRVEEVEFVWGTCMVLVYTGVPQ